MRVIANETVRNLVDTSTESRVPINIYKGDEFEVKWHDEITKDDCREMLKKATEDYGSPILPYEISRSIAPQKSYIEIKKIPDEYDKRACSKIVEFNHVEIDREQFEKLFSPIENHSKLHFERLYDGTTILDESDINKFIQNPNIKIDKIFEPDANTIDLWYTKYIGEWK